MSNLRIRYDLPAFRADGRPLPASEIAYVAVSISADNGTTFAEVARVAPPTREYLQTDLDPGLWFFRFVVVDTLGQSSAPVTASFDILPAAPGPVSNVVITRE